MSTIEDRFEYLDRLSDKQVNELCDLYRMTWWARQRQPSDVARMLQHSDVVLGFRDRDADRLVAFARVLSDFVYRATIWDVVVDERYRGQGLGKTLIQTLLTRPDLQHVESWLLLCLPEMVPFYESLGFTAGETCTQIMSLSREMLD